MHSCEIEMRLIEYFVYVIDGKKIAQIGRWLILFIHLYILILGRKKYTAKGDSQPVLLGILTPCSGLGLEINNGM